MPANAGIQFISMKFKTPTGFPAYAGMTNVESTSVKKLEPL
jgi:hypothetical protein